MNDVEKMRRTVGIVPMPIIHALEGRQAEVRIAHARPIEYKVSESVDKQGNVEEQWAPIDGVWHVRSTLRELQERPTEAAKMRFANRGGLTTVEVLTEDGWYKGEARCSEEDAFDRRIGRTLALERALERLEKVQESIKAKRTPEYDESARAPGMNPEVSWDREEPLPEIPEGATAEPSEPLWIQIEGLSTDEFPGDLSIIAEAELVINGEGIVLKDRFGPANRQATSEEIHQAMKVRGLCESRRGQILDHVHRDGNEEESWLQRLVRRARGW